MGFREENTDTEKISSDDSGEEVKCRRKSFHLGKIKN
jgi:hypothetical protein